MEAESINTPCKLCVIIILVSLTFGTCIHSLRTVAAQNTINQQQLNVNSTSLDSKLQVANKAVEQAFKEVLEAEKAGANITSFLVQLNDAANLLTQADNAYRLGDLATATNKTDSVLQIVQEISVRSQDARQAALILAQTNFWSIITFTIIAVLVFVSALFLVWRWFNKKYVNNLSSAKPEVTINEP